MMTPEAISRSLRNLAATEGLFQNEAELIAEQHGLKVIR